jgi:hypothetical protein
VRPTPGDRGTWSHGPIARVSARPAPEGIPANDLGATPGNGGPTTPGNGASAGAVARPIGIRPMPLPPVRGIARAPVPVGLRSGAATVPMPQRSLRPLSPPARGGFGLPSLRRNVCPHFYLTGSRGAYPSQAPHVLKSLIRQPNNISRCQLRGGVWLDEGYVNDVCLTPRFNQCVFYEDDLTRE